MRTRGSIRWSGGWKALCFTRQLDETKFNWPQTARVSSYVSAQRMGGLVSGRSSNQVNLPTELGSTIPFCRPESLGIRLPVLYWWYIMALSTFHSFYKYERCYSATELLQSSLLHFLHRPFPVNQMFLSNFAGNLCQAISSPDSESVVRRGSTGPVKTIFLIGRAYLRDHMESR